MSLLALAALFLAQADSPTLAERPAPRPEPVRFKGPIARWDEGLPLGNGTLGVLVWGEGNRIRLSLDRGDLWDLRPAEGVGGPEWTWATMRELKQRGDHAKHVALFDRPYDAVAHPTKLPGGRVELVLDDRFRVDGFKLDMARGTVSIDASRPLEGSARLYGGLTVQLHPTEPIVRVSGAWVERVELVRPAGLDRLGLPPADASSDGGGSAGWRALDQSTPSGEQVLAAAWGRSDPPHDGQPFIQSVCAVLARGEPGEAIALAQSGLDVYRIESWNPSRVTWRSDQPWIQIPDERLQFQYDLAAYLYRSSTAPGAPPMPLQGLWCADEGGLPPWKGDYHNDLNTQTTYTPYLAANLLEEGRTWLDFNWSLLPRYQRFAKEFYGLDGGAAAIPGVMALDGSPLGGWGQYSLSPTNGAWIAWQFAEHWRVTRDHAFLVERAAPFCFAVADGLLALLEPSGAEDALRLPLSTSPEFGDNAPSAWLAPNSNYDQALLVALFESTAKLAQMVGDTDRAKRFFDALRRLEPLDVAEDTGALTVARGTPFAHSHRHFSHALSIHPLGLLDPLDAANRAVIDATLDEIDERGTRAWVGYSFAWNAAMNAVAGRGDRALERLQQYLCFTGPNGFHLNGQQDTTGGVDLSDFRYRPFTLEGNFLAMDALQRMLLASRPGRVQVFPALPTAWRDAAFARLRAHDGLTVSASRRSGTTREVVVEASVAASFALEDPFQDQREVTWNRTLAFDDSGWARVELRAGETLIGRLAD